MKIIQMLVIGALVAGISLPTLAADDAVKTIANIVIGLNHFPNDAQKAELAAIAGDAKQSADMRTIATVLGGFAHQASAPDRDKLNAIVASTSADPAAKTLAGAVLNINHKPTPADVDALKALLE